MFLLVSRLDSGRAILEDPPHVDPLMVFIGKRAVEEGRWAYGNPPKMAREIQGKMFDTLLVQVSLFVYGVLYLLITYKIRNLPGKTKKDTANEVLYSLLWFAGGIIFPFSYSTPRL